MGIKYDRIIDQDSDERFDWKADYSYELTRVSDTIAASVWTADTGITVDETSYTELTATAFVSGGRAGFSYTVTNRVTTANGRSIECNLLFIIKS